MSGNFLVYDDDYSPDYDPEPMVRDIPGFSDYEVDSFGGITSYKTGSLSRIKPSKSNGKYHRLSLIGDDGHRQSFNLHRLLAEAFIPNPDHYPMVCHNDDDPDNNDLSNLRWGTASDNAADRIRNGKVHCKKVYCAETDTVYPSLKCASEELGIPASSISLACRGYNYTAHGYHLCYDEDMADQMENLEDWLVEKTNCKKVVAENLVTREVVSFDSLLEAAEYTGMHPASVSAVMNGRRTKSHNWIFY